MRERITFFHRKGDAVDPKTLKVQSSGLVGPELTAVREDRFTAALDDLPRELADLLRGYQELHLRWASSLDHETLDPFASQISPGLHFFAKPLKAEDDDLLNLCRVFQILGPIDCKSPKAFTISEAEDDSGVPWHYFFHKVDNLRSGIASLSQILCPGEDSLCPVRLRAASSAASVDVSYDAATQLLKTSYLSPLQQQAITVARAADRRVEVGLLGGDSPPSLEPHELGVSGSLVVLGEKKEPSPALFAIPARHRTGAATFSSKFLTPTGLHPTLQLSLSSNLPPVEDEYCIPHVYLTLPKSIFADRYQLEDSLFLASKNLTASRYTSLPVDLEAPTYTTETWGSSVLLELAPPKTAEKQAWTAEVPLHLRYLEPSESGETNIEVPYPVVFWACESNHDGQFENNPFDRVRLGYDSLFNSATAFWHVKPEPLEGGRLTIPVTVPVLKTEGSQIIGTATLATVALGCAYILWVLASVYLRTGHGEGRADASFTGQKGESKKKR